jgi:transcription-repair coupling factor (superfamily II helicase)
VSGIDEVFRPLLRSRPFVRLLAAARGEGPARTLTGLTESAKALFLVLLRRELGRPVLVITPDDKSLEEWRRDLAAFSRILDPGGRLGRVLRFPALDADPYLGLPPHFQVSCERVTTLHRVARSEASFVVTPVRALINPLPSPWGFAALSLPLERGKSLDLDGLARRLVEQGYRTVDVVGSAGEWARRGGIVDIWPPSEETPVRIELVGDDVESLRRFDPDSQRSLEPLDSADILPVGEAPMDAPSRERLARVVTERTGARFAGSGHGSATELAGSRWLALLRGEEFQGIEGCAGLALEEVSDLFSHLYCSAPAGGANAPLPEAATLIALDEPDRTGEELDAVYAELSESREQTGGPLPRPEELFLSPRRLRACMARAPVSLAELRVGEGIDDVSVLCQPSRNYAGRVPEWQNDIRRSLDSGRRVVLLLNTPGTLERTRELLDDGAIAYTTLPAGEPAGTQPPEASPVHLMTGHLNHGFLLPDIGLIVLAERELYGEEPRPQTRKKRRPGASFVSDFRDLRIGDTVVHIDHGIGRYEGLHRMGGAASHRDFMLLTYESGDRLFVPVDRLDLVQKYSVPGGGRAKVDRLGGTGWERRRKKVRKAVEDIARDLLHLYARRLSAAGTKFSPDTPWQREFEDAFPYTLTPDQERAIQEVKADLESDKPMERLLCGDVGYGKTEVAMRAAFKVVQDGYQVAVLAPTTVLAFQHLNTFRERFAAFPVKIDMLSRFRTPAEAKVIARRVEAGEVDIIIGTHRLLSKDVSYHKLGLLVVDEEQRFGVAHKERLKKISQGVDVLAMSATPIPRTLQMSLAGVRDMSVIETPPQNRLAIQTNLIPYKRGIIAAAIRNEMRRDGQIYFVHNRVETVYAIAAKIQELVPEARLAVAHGQMGRAELESVMLRFLRGEFHILCSTTIIENGLDIPRVNTLIANRADRFGLAQLYQLRGRIGRSDVRAYAYFIIPGRGGLSPVARRRLAALQEFSDLGSGFRLAALDLEIRGAGELLGARQHGHIADIGFDLYVQMLERAVKEIQGEEVTEPLSVQINLGVDIRLPDAYLPEPSLRLAFYKRVSSAEDGEELEQIRSELEDRFGELPATGDNLIRMAALRLDAMKAGVKGVEFAGGKVALQFAEPPRIAADELVGFVQRTPGATLTPAGVLRVSPPPARDRIEAARAVVGDLVAGLS